MANKKISGMDPIPIVSGDELWETSAPAGGDTYDTYSMSVSQVASYTVNSTALDTVLEAKTLLRNNNLSDLDDVPEAQSNLGLGTAATENVSAFLQTANNLSDLANIDTARTNLHVDYDGYINDDIEENFSLANPMQTYFELGFIDPNKIVTLPPANESNSFDLWREFKIKNNGEEPFDIASYGGALQVVSLRVGHVAVFILTDNTTPAGEYSVNIIGDPFDPADTIITNGVANSLDIGLSTPADAQFVDVDITGTLTLAADPTTDLEAATKQYVDAQNNRGVNSVILASSNITLTNPMASVQQISFDGAGHSLILPIMNASDSYLLGDTFIVKNAGSFAFAIAKNGSSNVIDALNPGQVAILEVTDVSTAAGSFLSQVYLLASNSLSDVASASDARTNLGLGSAALLASSAVLQTANNLSEVTPATARTNIGALASTGGTATNLTVSSGAINNTPIGQTTPALLAELRGFNIIANTTYTLTASDCGKLVIFQNTNPKTLTLPQTSTETIPANFWCILVNQAATGSLAIATQGSDILFGSNSYNAVQSGIMSKSAAGAINQWQSCRC
jgi:hypothetical protein